MRRTTMLMVTTLVVLAACGSAPSHALDVLEPPAAAGQPTILEPPDRERRGGDAQLTVQVVEGTFADRWDDLRDIAPGVGGWIANAQQGISEYRGTRYPFGTVQLEVPLDRFESTLNRISALGTLVSSDVAYDFGVRRDTASISATITESPAPAVVVDAGPESRVDQALDTAGDVLLTIVSVLIVAGAVVIPVAALVVLSYAVWRAVRRRWPLAEMVVAETARTPEPSSPDS